MKFIIIGIVALGIWLVSANICSVDFIFITTPIVIFGVMLTRGGWKYVSTERDDPWDGKQYEFSENGQNYVVKDGVTYRQAKELGRAPGYDWGEPANWERIQRTRHTKVVKARVRRVDE